MQGWDEALPALNAARAEQGLEPLEHVLDQGRSAALTLVMTSSAFDFMGELPPVVKHVGPRLDDPLWAEDWTAPEGEDPLVLVQRIADALATMPVRGVLTTGRAVDPGEIEAPEGVQVVRSAPHAEVLREAAAVITHCGHGTTIKALAAGVPLVCLPMGRDQLDVAARVVHRGAGVRLDPASDPADIAAALTRVLAEPSYREAAGRIAAVITEETSSDRVVAEIEALIGERAEVRV
jgi:glycosyltransferase involved in cell wall biosynthesis